MSCLTQPQSARVSEGTDGKELQSWQQECLKSSPTKQALEYWHPNGTDWAHKPGSGWKGQKGIRKKKKKKKKKEVRSAFSGWAGHLQRQRKTLGLVTCFFPRPQVYLVLSQWHSEENMSHRKQIWGGNLAFSSISKTHSVNFHKKPKTRFSTFHLQIELFYKTGLGRQT